MSWVDIVKEVVDTELLLESGTLCLGFGLSALFRHFYNLHLSTSERVTTARNVIIDKNLHEAVAGNESNFQYVALSGRVQADDKPLQSRYFPERKGVILNFVTEERKETWAKYSQVWYESDRELSNITETVPFSLTEGKDAAVHIVDPLDSPWCKHSLSTINREFRDPNSSVMNSIVGLVTGDRVKGYTDTEKMLQVGTRLLGIGKLITEDSVVKLKRPSTGEYILTNSTQQQVIAYLNSRVKFWRIFSLLFFGATLGGLYFVAKSLWKKYLRAKENQRRQEEIRDIRSQRLTNHRITGNASNTNRDEACIICLSNPRECVILNCGHVCACVDCIEILPNPKTCPICRAVIDKIIPLFHA